MPILLNKKGAKRGVSTVEYIVLFTAGISVLIIFMRPNGLFSSAVTSSYNKVSSSMSDMSDRLGRSRGSFPPTLGPPIGGSPIGTIDP